MGKISIITTGFLQCRRSLLEPGSGTDTVTVPVRCYLLHCSGSWWLFDTGQTPPELPQSPDAPFKIIVDETQTAGAQLRRAGINLTGIVISHAHRDHTAGLRDFPGVRTLIQKRETATSAGTQLLQDFPQQWEIIDGEYDFSGDGTMLAVPTFGHTLGHQSLLVCDHGNETLFAIDAAYTEKCIASASELEIYRRMKYKIIPGHPVI